MNRFAGSALALALVGVGILGWWVSTPEAPSPRRDRRPIDDTDMERTDPDPVEAVPDQVPVGEVAPQCEHGLPSRIKAIQVTTEGTRRARFDPELNELAVSCWCLTTEIDREAAANEQLLPEVFLFDVTAGAGTKTFELYTPRHIKGNRGRYYESDCLYEIVLEGFEAREERREAREAAPARRKKKDRKSKARKRR